MALKVQQVKEYQFWAGDFLKARENAGLTQQQLSEQLGFWSQQRISQIEGQILPITIHEHELQKLQEILQIQLV